jgi:aspartate kinase
MKVIKFGGTSLADGQHLAKALDIINSDADREVVVVSAPGKRFKDDTKVTDLLVQLAETAINGASTEALTADIIGRYQAIAAHFSGDYQDILSSLATQLEMVLRRHYPSFDHLFAAITAQGENLNAQLVAAILNENGTPAEYISPIAMGLTLTGNPRNARLQEDSYTKIGHFERPTQRILVVPGFFGALPDGQLATFSRGGSDITGAILARAFNADVYENFTDVSAIFAVDPHIIPDPQAIAQMSYREMRELAYAGFAVFHEEAILPVIETGVKINVKNTNEPSAPGTLIVPVAQADPSRIVTGIASDDRFAALYLHKYLLNQEVGFTLRLLQILANHGISYEHMPSGIDDLTIILDKTQLTPETKAAIQAEIAAEVHPDEMTWIDDYAIIMVVGEGLRTHVTALDEITHALAEKNINVPMINQGASQISLMLGVHTADVATAVEAIYKATFTD